MKLGMFSVRDVVAGAFINPWFLPNDGMAVRAFTDCVRDPNHNFGAHPGDYALYKMGDFEPESGKVNVLSEPEQIATGFECQAVIAREDARQLRLLEEAKEA